MGKTVVPLNGIFDTATGAMLGFQPAGGSPGAYIPAPVGGSSVPQPLSADYTVVGGDDGKTFYCTTPLVLTISAQANVIVDAPPTGLLTIRSAGGIKLNGALTDITRSQANNPAGVVIRPWATTADSVGVSGA